MTTDRTRHRGPGRRAGLSRERVIDAALVLLDDRGVGALTMRRLAAELEVEAMTLYNYVPTKAALLDALVERVFTEAVPGPAGAASGPTGAVPGPAGAVPGSVEGAPGSAEARREGHAEGPDDWAVFLRDYATRLRTGLLRHPGVLPLAAARPAATPAALAAVEHGLSMLTAAGFPLGRALDAINSVTLFALGHTAAEVGTADATASADWVAGQDPERYPLLTEAARTRAGTDDADRFAHAVDALVTGFEQNLCHARQEQQEQQEQRAPEAVRPEN
ncbi:TetR/AcrR family transcriptional regulator C-terminal domain-containing protein [Streptomyces sp. NPDC002559]